MICQSSCVWDLLLYYFTELPQPIHGFRARVGQVSGGAQRRSEPQDRHLDRLLRGGGPAVHASAETTDSSAEAVQGDPLSAREISSCMVGCLYQGMVSCTDFISSPANHVFIAPLGWSLSLLGMLLGGWRVDESVGVGGWGFGLLQCGHVKGERCLEEPS